MWLKPTYFIDGDITDIDLDMLYKNGIRGLLFDLDSTLLAPNSGVLTQSVSLWLEKARSKFKLAIVSNNKKDHYLDKVKILLDMPTFGRASKPRRRVIREAMKALNLEPQVVALIGDRPLTDILGGMRAGIKTILVYPLKTMNEPGWIKFFRNLERLIIRS